MIIDYNEQTLFTKSIDIVDVGNFCLRCIGKATTEYYVLVKTVMGKTTIVKFGPVIPEVPILANGFTTTCKICDYKESTIIKETANFVNDAKKEIEDVQEIDSFEALENFPNLKDIWFND